MAQDYNSTVNLPKTEFPMRAGLPKREPGMLETFYQKDVYGTLMKKNEGKPLFILHDGPPYANGNIHIGHALNKILKDFIVRYKNMTGYKAPYVPGWDTHGLPIESAILKSSKLKRSEMTDVEFRGKCRDFAKGFVDVQREDFKRLGVIGDWEHPYLTLTPEYEAQQIRVFGEMAKKGYIYKGRKPVYWCPSDETALAEAEIEYSDDPCTTIFVKFRLQDDLGKLPAACDKENTYFVIWTTTTWTIPGNMAICLNPELEYSVVRASNGETYVMAKELYRSVLEKAGLTAEQELWTAPGSAFEYMTARHPLYDRTSLVINGDHVTLDSGTGLVHTAPAYGVDDFNICRKYPEIETGADMVVNVNGRGRFTSDAGKYEGLNVLQAHEPIFADLQAAGAILASEKIVHSYPHCWRCKKPVIFRATEQWFASVNAIKEDAVAACDEIKWNPEWGKERMVSMIRERADWCISRQRSWGVPIPIFYCDKCGREYVTEQSINAVADLFEKEGSDAWFTHEAADILPAGTKCPHCGGEHFTKETDIMDVWFDSGSAHAGVLGTRSDLAFPADVYLEGGDQYRGWFQSSMLTAIAACGKAPFRQIITHGWTVDGEGKAMHKSLGNTIAPADIIKDYGADILRLWVSSADYRADMRISKDILKQLSDMYLKIRNTARYILGNLADFDPDAPVPYEQLQELDKWALYRFNDLCRRVRAAYERYEYHTISHSIHNFCAVDLSNFYLDIIKDRLYCDTADSLSRRSAQTAIYTILDGLVRLIAPLLAFTSEEIWAAMPHHAGADRESVLFNDIPEVSEQFTLTPEQERKWTALIALRDDVNKALELARAEKTVGKPLDADVTLFVSATAEKPFSELEGEDLEQLFIVSRVNVVRGEGEGVPGTEFPGVTVLVQASQGAKCIRCWKHDDRVGEDTDHPELCPRCAAAVKSQK